MPSDEITLPDEAVLLILASADMAQASAAARHLSGLPGDTHELERALKQRSRSAIGGRSPIRTGWEA